MTFPRQEKTAFTKVDDRCIIQFPYYTLRPQTAKKSSFHGFPVTDKTVNGIGAEASRVRVNFRFSESACLSRALSCSTVILPFSWETAARKDKINE